jgi:hypothetical protein
VSAVGGYKGKGKGGSCIDMLLIAMFALEPTSRCSITGENYTVQLLNQMKRNYLRIKKVKVYLCLTN